MQRSQILDAAADAAIDAWARKQYEAVPHILAGYATALMQTSMMARLFRYTDVLQATAGNIITLSPTRCTRVTETQHVKPLKLVCRPAISLQKGLTREKVFDVCHALLTGADRLFYNVVRQKVEVLASDMIDAVPENQRMRSITVALVGSDVPISYASKLAGTVIPDTGEPQHKVLLSNEMLLACLSPEGLLGEYTLQPVRCRPVGYPDEKLPHLAIVEADPKFPEGHEYHNSLQFNLVTELAISVHQPAGFLLVGGIPE